MAVRMLIDAAHPEETRVVVLDGNRLEEFDVETASRRPLKGNIYLAKVTRVEPSLQAAFVEYGGNRHGFIPFAEIHPDYYQIPVADRQALIAAQAAEADSDDDDDQDRQDDKDRAAEEARIEAAETARADNETPRLETGNGEPVPERADFVDLSVASEPLAPAESATPASPAISTPEEASVPAPPSGVDSVIGSPSPDQPLVADGAPDQTPAGDAMTEIAAPTEVESVGGDDASEEVRRPRTRHIRSYRIQEVIKRRQILLVQVVKEERGTKGAALTTYISLAGRYCVLMPNSPRGGGVSRKIANPGDRKRLKSIAGDMDVPDGMGVIVRTAGLNRSKPEIKRDFEYLLRLWDSIRELTLRSTAPALVYEEANLIKRSIRDLFHGEIDEILVEGEQGYQFARDFMSTLMPGHAGRVKHYTDRVPLLQRYQIEQQLDGIHLPQVQLKSGGTIVFGQTEALVAIDVNSGRATRERNIEETATKTNLEAAEEIARQLRLRDLAGLIVIDFIDMEDGSNNRAVERKLKECLKSDRARIQVGRISPFGLLEMSRQRLRQSLQEASTNICPHCRGTGLIRSTDQSALVALRAIEDEAAKDRASEITVAVAPQVALYLLNQKRAELMRIEEAHRMAVVVSSDDKLIPPEVRIDRTKPRTPGQHVAAPAPIQHVTHESVRPPELESETEVAAADDLSAEQVESEYEAPRTAGDERDQRDAREPRGDGQQGDFGRDGSRRRRRRRRRGGGGGQFRESGQGGQQPQGRETLPDAEVSLNNPPPSPVARHADQADAGAAQSGPDTDHDHRGRRRRGRRGGRRNRRDERKDFGGDQASAPAPQDASRANAVTEDAQPRVAPTEAPSAAPPVAEIPTPWTTEPAPTPSVPSPPPVAAVDVAPTAEPDPSKPRKTGWWRRTFGGG